MANAGLSVSAADLTAAWTNNAAAAGFTGNGTFSGYSRLYAGAIWNNVFLFLSDDEIIVQLEDTSNNTFCCFTGMGVRGVTDAVPDCESGLGGRLFDLGGSGSGGAINATLWSVVANGTGALTGHGTTAGNAHWYYRIPGQNTSSSALTMRPMSNRLGNGALANFMMSYTTTSSSCVAASGAVEPEALVLRDAGTTTARAYITVGRSRVFFYGPPAKTKSILSAAGVKKWIALAGSVSVAQDAVMLPYAA